MDEQKKPILTLEYTIQPEEYLHFNQYFAKENFQAKKNKTTLVGAIETVVALILLYATATGEGQYRLMPPLGGASGLWPVQHAVLHRHFSLVLEKRCPEEL